MAENVINSGPRGDQKIGDMTRSELSRFISNQLANETANLPTSLTGQTVKATKLLVVADRIQLTPQALQYIKTNLPP